MIGIDGLDWGIYYHFDAKRTAAGSQLTTFLTLFGTYVASALVVLTTTLLLFVKRRFRDGAILWTSLLIATTIIELLIFTIARPRPDAAHRLAAADERSFPSDHVFLACLSYGFLLSVVQHMLTSRWLQTLCTLAITTLIFLISLSYVYLGLHFASDVVASLTAALAVLVFVLHATPFLHPNAETPSS